MSVKDIKGKRFGRLTVLELDGIDKNHRAIWKCQCDCGKTTFADTSTLNRGLKKSCGCLGYEYKHSPKNSAKTHGKTKTRLHAVWSGMKQRCNNPSSENYARYGGRGIQVCKEWENDFSAFEQWAFSNGYDETAKQGDCTIDRIDNDGPYAPWNCRWVSMKVQYYNRDVPKSIAETAREHGLTKDAVYGRMRKNGMTLTEALQKPMRENKYMTFNGETRTISAWARITGIAPATLFYRANHGWSDEKSLTTGGLFGGVQG